MKHLSITAHHESRGSGGSSYDPDWSETLWSGHLCITMESRVIAISRLQRKTRLRAPLLKCLD